MQMPNDSVANTLDLIRIIAKGIKPFKGLTGHDSCDDCNQDCIATAFEIVESITEKYTIVSKDE